jgi:hypothetical protein
MSVLEFCAIIICDDIRKEINNKDILIGVYSGDIVVSSLPAWLPMAFWIEASAKQIGRHDRSFRITVADNPPLVLKSELQIEQLGSLAIMISGLQIYFEKEGTLLLEVQEGEEWKTLKSKKIIIGQLPSGSPIPTFVSGRPSDL